MSSRQGAYVTVQVPVYGGVSPNAYRGVITVEIRAFWPPYLGHEDHVIDLINKAAEEAVRKVIRDGHGDHPQAEVSSGEAGWSVQGGPQRLDATQAEAKEGQRQSPDFDGIHDHVAEWPGEDEE